MSDRVVIALAEDGVADVRLNRPDKLNALDAEMFEALVAAGDGLAREPGLRAVVLSGEGRAFCAGLDFAGFRQTRGARRPGPPGTSSSAAPGAPRTTPSAPPGCGRSCPVPVIAALHGVAYGGGLQIALAADVRIVAPDARLSVRELHWGLVPDMSGTQTLRHLVRADVARELTYTARIVSGSEAVSLGLATRASESPREDAFALAREIAARSPDAVRAAKRLLEGACERRRRRGPAPRGGAAAKPPRPAEPGRGGARQPRAAPAEVPRPGVTAAPMGARALYGTLLAEGRAGARRGGRALPRAPLPEPAQRRARARPHPGRRARRGAAARARALLVRDQRGPRRLRLRLRRPAPGGARASSPPAAAARSSTCSRRDAARASPRRPAIAWPCRRAASASPPSRPTPRWVSPGTSAATRRSPSCAASSAATRRSRLLTQNPEKAKALEEAGVRVAGIVPLAPQLTAWNRHYLAAKSRSGHAFADPGEGPAALPEPLPALAPGPADAAGRFVRVARYLLPVLLPGQERAALADAPAHLRPHRAGRARAPRVPRRRGPRPSSACSARCSSTASRRASGARASRAGSRRCGASRATARALALFAPVGEAAPLDDETLDLLGSRAGAGAAPGLRARATRMERAAHSPRRWPAPRRREGPVTRGAELLRRRAREAIEAVRAFGAARVALPELAAPPRFVVASGAGSSLENARLLVSLLSGELGVPGALRGAGHAARAAGPRSRRGPARRLQPGAVAERPRASRPRARLARRRARDRRGAGERPRARRAPSRSSPRPAAAWCAPPRRPRRGCCCASSAPCSAASRRSSSRARSEPAAAGPRPGRHSKATPSPRRSARPPRAGARCGPRCRAIPSAAPSRSSPAEPAPPAPAASRASSSRGCWCRCPRSGISSTSPTAASSSSSPGARRSSPSLAPGRARGGAASSTARRRCSTGARHRVLRLRAQLPSPYAILEHDVMLNELLLAASEARGLDPSHWPGQERDAALYTLEAPPEEAAAPDSAPRELARLVWPELEALLARGADTAVVPLGSTEQHGPHLPFATDTWLADALAERFCARVPEAVRLPALPFGCASEHLSFPGTLHLRAETLAALLEDLVASLDRHGFRHVFVLLRPRRQRRAAARSRRRASRARRRAPGDRLRRPGPRGGGAPRAGRRSSASTPAAAGHHAGEIETSLLLALAPGEVRCERIGARPPRRGRRRAGALLPGPPRERPERRGGRPARRAGLARRALPRRLGRRAASGSTRTAKKRPVHEGHEPARSRAGSAARAAPSQRRSPRGSARSQAAHST